MKSILEETYRYTGECVILVTGGRDFRDFLRVCRALDHARSLWPAMALLQGGARGADAHAKAWAISRGVPGMQFDALWETHGNSAGPRRNEWMYKYCKPNAVIAFPGGHGTADAIRRANQKGITVYAG